MIDDIEETSKHHQLQGEGVNDNEKAKIQVYTNIQVGFNSNFLLRFTAGYFVIAYFQDTL